MKAINYQVEFNYIQSHTLRLEASRRGGGIEIDAREYLGKMPGTDYLMTAYQNYLGGGLTGSIQSDYNYKHETMSKTMQAKHDKLTEAVKRYFFNITNDEVADWDEWAVADDYEAQQKRPGSAY